MIQKVFHQNGQGCFWPKTFMSPDSGIAEEMWPEITSFIRTVLKETVEALKHHMTPVWE